MLWFSDLFSYVLEPVSVVMLLMTGIVTAFRSGFVVYRKLGRAMLLPFSKPKDLGSGLSSFSAAMTALAGTLGTGNMIGVGTAILTGGAGALFWMVAAAFVGMSVKYAEIFLACKTRVSDQDGVHGGPMYYIRDLLKSKFFAAAFAVCCILSGFGIGNLAQTAAIGSVMRGLPLPKNALVAVMITVALLFAGCLQFGMSGGAQRVGGILSVLTPAMAVFYLLGCFAILFMHRERIPEALCRIFREAFAYESVAGGMLGSGITAVFRSVKTGFTRGLFTNESGLGSAPIVHACCEEDADTAGLWGVFEVFFDTVLMCSITGLTLLVGAPREGSFAADAVFYKAFGIGGSVFLCAALTCFALAAALGWGFYGEQCIRFLRPCATRLLTLYRSVYSLISVFGFFAAESRLFLFTDAANALMLLINTAAMLPLLCANRIILNDFQSNAKRSVEIKRKQDVDQRSAGIWTKRS